MSDCRTAHKQLVCVIWIKQLEDNDTHQGGGGNITILMWCEHCGGSEPSKCETSST